MPRLPHQLIQALVFVTDFGDAGLVIPVCITVGFVLLLLGRRRVALIWALVFLAVFGTMLLVKLAGYALQAVDPAPRSWEDVLTASGHVAAGAFAYGSLAGLLIGSARSAVRRSCLAALAVAVVIGATRIVLREHTPAEVAVGGLVGVAGAAAFAALAGEVLHGKRRLLLLTATLVAIAMLHGAHVTWESTIAAASARAVQAWRGPPAS